MVVLHSFCIGRKTIQDAIELQLTCCEEALKAALKGKKGSYQEYARNSVAGSGFTLHELIEDLFPGEKLKILDRAQMLTKNEEYYK